VFIALFTLALWVSTDRLWKAGERQITVANTAANAAQTTAEASAKQLDTFIITQMPALLPLAHGNIETDDSADSVGFSVKLELKNTGLTAARKVSFWVNAAWLPIEIGPDFDFKPPSRKTTTAAQVLQDRSIMSARMEIPRPVLNNLVRGNGYSYVWARCEYDNIFPNTPRKWFTYCVQIQIMQDVFTMTATKFKAAMGQSGRPIEVVHFLITEHGNDSGSY